MFILGSVFQSKICNLHFRQGSSQSKICNMHFGLLSVSIKIYKYSFGFVFNFGIEPNKKLCDVRI